MYLTENEVDLYFDLMWKLQWYVNKEHKIIYPVKTPADYEEVDMEDKAKVREYLFDNYQTVAKSFIEVNPFYLDSEEIAIIQQWEKHIKGDFLLERFLKSYSVFIAQDSDNVYGVLGLHEPLSEIIDKRTLPVCVEAILLPFKGKIIYDGILKSYPFFFGSGIKGELKQLYLTAKQNQAIITDLETQKTRQKVEVLPAGKNWQPEIQDLINKAKKLRGGGGQPAIYSPVFSLVKLSLDLADKTTSDSLDLDYFYKKMERLESLIRQIENQAHRMDR